MSGKQSGNMPVLCRAAVEAKFQRLCEGSLSRDMQVPRSHKQRMQSETARKTQDCPNSCRVSQPKGLRRTTPDASDVAVAERNEMHRQQHGKIHHIFVGGLRFIDSLNFLQESLDSLVSVTPKESLKLTRSISKGSDLLLQKGIYPYEYVDSWQRFIETRLPDKEKFYSKLNDKHISDEEYAHTQRVWDALGCKTLEDFHDLYVQTDVALLADVFGNFRNL